MQLNFTFVQLIFDFMTNMVIVQLNFDFMTNTTGFRYFGEAPRAHGEDLAEGRARRSADGNYRHGKGRVCRVPNFGHTANNFAVCLSRYIAQKSKKTV